ncbi:MAG: cellulase family glycosylhydrolase, partial [Anaerolineaceae bacterium]|nr:cellulase family glycosylhydrolase [Anaerolineaceae bacterium]
MNVMGIRDAGKMEKISVRGKDFIDEDGRVRIFHGVNLVCKSKNQGYIGDWKRSDFEDLRQTGFNLVRLGLFWDGVEPEPGVHNEAYLDRIEGILDLCGESGLYVLLDMHQDLYSVLYSDGAPEWATFTDGLPAPEEGNIWSDAYLTSEVVQHAFDHFWANDPVPADGIGLQDHLAGCWQRIAQRFGARPGILGYDFLNEPFPGSAALPMFGTLLGAYAQIEAHITGNPPKSIEEAIAAFTDPHAKNKVLQLLDDRQIYQSLVSSAETIVAEFDSSVLRTFYERMAAAVRSVTPNGILFVENNYFSNMGTPSAVQPISLGGIREKQQGFTPHGYDLVVDTPQVGSGASENRAAVIFEGHHAVQQRLYTPVLVGEWGGFGSYADVARHCTFLLETFDRYGWSFTYWEWLG